MEQRDFSPWSQFGHSRPRLLIEDPDPALRVADSSLFTESGLDVALCSGPSADELHRRRPALPVLVEVPRHGTETAPGSCVPLRLPASVDGQIRAVWRALDRPGLPAPAPTSWPPDPAVPTHRASDPTAAAPWPLDPSAPAPSTAGSSLEARLADLLGW